MTPSPSPLPGLSWSGATDPGRVRPQNEDAFLGLRFNAREVHHLGRNGRADLADTDLVYAVSDGMGGALAGEYASRIAVDKITQLLPRSFRHAAASLDNKGSQILHTLFQEVHRALAYLGASYEECHGMETTLSLAWFAPDRMIFAHIGDSRVYHLPARTNQLTQLTQDDTHVGWLFRTGKINEREARTHPRRNVLQKALGGENQFVNPQLGCVEYQPGDLFLLCSDGLTEGIPHGDLEKVLQAVRAGGVRSPSAHQLVNTAVERDGRDNTTAVLVQIDPVPAVG